MTRTLETLPTSLISALVQPADATAFAEKYPIVTASGQRARTVDGVSRATSSGRHYARRSHHHLPGLYAIENS